MLVDIPTRDMVKKMVEEEVKYKVWDNKEKRMLIGGVDNCITIDMEGLIYYLGEFRPEYQERFVILLYIGLKDKKGWKIYKGDICKIDSLKADKVIVGWDNERFKFTLTCIKVHDGSDFSKIKSNELEVIGNTHENPELLKRSVIQK